MRLGRARRERETEKRKSAFAYYQTDVMNAVKETVMCPPLNDLMTRL